MTPCLANAKPDFEIVQRRNLRAAALSADLSRFRRSDRDPQRRAAGTDLGDFHERHARGGEIPERGRAAIAGSPTSTPARAARKSAARLAARKRPAAAAKAEAIRGRLHAAADEHDQLFDRASAGAGNPIWRRRRQRDGLIPTGHLADSEQRSPQSVILSKAQPSRRIFWNPGRAVLSSKTGLATPYRKQPWI